jgi:hypothetical protein
MSNVDLDVEGQMSRGPGLWQRGILAALENIPRNMEALGAEPITSSAVNVRNVQLALEALGIEFLDHGQPGVRLRKPAAAPAEPTSVSKPVLRTKTVAPRKTRPRRS